MDILPNEVESVNVIGKLFDDDIKIVKTNGGFHVAIGKKKRNSKKAEVLAGGSHPAIIAHQLSKDYGSDFQPSLAKSEHERMPQVEEKTKYLSSQSIASGIELFTLHKNEELEFVLCKRGGAAHLMLGRYQAEIKGDTLLITKGEFKNSTQSDRQTAEAISRAMRDKMYELDLSQIERL